MNVVMDCEATNAFYRAEEEGKRCRGGEMAGDK
jgi:hypothetical protein